MFCRSVAIRVAIFSLCLGLASCGGGGGGGSAGPTPNPTPPPADDTSFGTLAISSSNAEVLGLGISISEGALAFTQIAINAVVEFAVNGETLVSCGNTGTISIGLVDNDTSFDVSAGDEVSVSFSDCYRSVAEGDTSGEVRLQLTSFSLDGESVSMAGGISTEGDVTLIDPADPSVVVDVSGAYSFNFAIQPPEVLSISATGSERFDVSVLGTTESISDFTIAKTATRLAPGSSAANVNTDVSVDLAYDSDLYGGTFSCRNGTAGFIGTMIDLPQSASIICRGRNASAVRVTDQNAAAVDAEGDGSFETLGTLDWGAVIDGFLQTDSGLVLDDLSGDLRLRRVGVRSNDLVYDATRDRLLVTTSSTDPTYPGVLLAVDLNNNVISTLHTYSDEPNIVRVSDDGSRVYVSFTDKGEIQSYDGSTLQPLALLTVQSDETFSTEYEVLDVEVSPTDSDTIAVAFRFLGSSETDIVLFRGGAQLTNSYRDAFAPAFRSNFNVIEFSSDADQLFASSTQGGFGLLIVDANGVTSAYRVSNVFNSRMERVGDRLISGARTFDADTLVKTGTYWGSSWADALDAPNDLALVLSEGVLRVYDATRFTPIGTFDLGLSDPNVINRIVPAGNFAILREDSTLHVLEIADIAVVEDDECAVVASQTDDSESYTIYSCPIEDAVYDPVRDRIYAAVSGSLGVNGNSIAVIDPSLQIVESYVHVGSDPRAIALSADSNSLYVAFYGADTINTLDLNSLSVTAVQPIDLVVSPTDPSAFEPRRVTRLTASPTENGTFLASLARFTGNRIPERLTTFSNGTRLADEVFISQLQGNPSFSQHVIFDDAGQPYSLNDGGTRNIQALTLGPSGLSVGPYFETPNLEIGEARPDVFQSFVHTSMGGIADLVNQTSEPRFDTRAPSFDDGGGGLAINVDAANNEAWLLFEAPGGSGIAKYDYGTGAFLAEQALDVPPDSRFEERLFDAGSDSLGVIANPALGLVVIEKSAIQ